MSERFTRGVTWPVNVALFPSRRVDNCATTTEQRHLQQERIAKAYEAWLYHECEAKRLGAELSHHILRLEAIDGRRNDG